MLSRLAIDLPALRRPGIAHISLTLVGLMWVLPFLYYHHAYPLTTFYQEWGTALLGLGASGFLLSKQQWQQPEIPRIVLLPISLMLLALVQYLLGRATYFDQTLLFTLYMLWATLLMMLGRALRERFGLPVMATALAAFLLLGTELGALAGVLQHYRWHTFLDSVITSKNGAAIYGNMAQPNHYANYIAMGLVSLGFLRLHMRTWQAVLLAAPLLFVMVLSGSRSSWLYLLSMVVLSYLWQRREISCRHLLNYSLLLLLGFGLMHLVVQIPWLAAESSGVTTLQRMTADSTGSIRLYLWREAWLIFSQFPLLGAGLGQFAWQHFQLGPVLQATYITGLYNNAHNLVMHIAAEMGLAGLLILFGALYMWIRQALRAQFSTAHWFACTVLLVLGIHSMLEYPLWYAYFMGIAAILLGALDNSTYRLEMHRLGRLSVAAVLLLGLLSLIQLQQGYQRLERSLNSRPKSIEDKSASLRMREELIAVHGMPLLRPYAELFMNNWIEISETELENKLELNERAIKFVPLGTPAYRRAMLLALAGRQEEARVQIERAIWSYPGDFAAQSRELSALAQKDPAHFSALLEFAIQKNEEYSSAVSTR
ncbi:MAG TPA: Wzy polymerase domain-containing protein [Gallionellaceae bacterium]|nr:Wzy polymerase domain-containing protein [Gallionellaceae bacterium]HQS75333.1 Wzy polymerase domain-containing protein [Gallionellaceae bacterium]